MADRSSDADRALPCGRTVGELVGYHADGGTPELAAHVAGCPHCQAELAELDSAWAAVRRAASLPVEPPDGLVDRALTTVRGIRGGAGSAPLEFDQDGGSLRISPQAVLVLARRTCAEILTAHPGVHLRGCGGDVDEVRIDLQVQYPLPAPALAEMIRTELADRLHVALGGAAPAVWIRIADVAPPESSDWVT
ncbi:hypothetical protein A8924_2268 [Saccharopolyspora erythraea NRRL 2338]|uniref:Uncharacterized protein n=2 Tax=Saccharopolyspora erythraea TaxID=1836 RepID=A4FAV6_SACEN|nr:hypothetical protein [Saccharopolyspora erythraea]EQD87574.1 hypothetical protein N599_03315 [Saccharopolyspora erythraea D]PFG94963.1 hypothetical protein A8924_2268 [Saccharopolyspora erythraea NRRL 2338]QRK91655.1 hypothetical protein JQX30_09895 [Saccharopolyspora erythraea]CAM01181.1 hypothetical protein SACE_1869 [Saccharopolyspora erythraea NRRL 2338]